MAVVDNALRGQEDGRRIASAAHELKNPVGAITNLVYLLQQNFSLDKSARQYLDQLTDELNHIRHIIRQTLDLYRASAKHVSVPIERLLDTVLAFYDHKVQFKQVAIEKRYTSHSVVQAFSEELRQVFTNLVVNALEALPRRGGRLVIHTFRSRDWNNPERTGIRVVIADNGSGIELQHREKIFQPHFTTKGDKGTGLGLWVSAEFIRKLQGSIRLKTSTQPDRNGTIFSVFLPDNLVAAPV